MIKKLLYIGCYYALGLLFFNWGRLYFFMLNAEGQSLSLMDYMQSGQFGISLDLSVLSYLLIIPLVVKAFPLSTKLWSAFFKFYFGVVAVSVLFISAADALNYKYWGSKFNLLFVQYLGDLQAGAASVAPEDLLMAVLFFLISMLFLILFWKKSRSLPFKRGMLNLLLLLPVLILARGGVGKTPIGVSSAFHHSNPLINNAALNPAWNAMAYEWGNDKEEVVLLPEAEMTKLVQALQANEQQPITSILTNDSSKVILIVLESFSAKMSALFSNKSNGYTPHLDSLAKEGLAFTSAYASSFRSDRGLTALLTGIPSLSTRSVTDYPSTLEKWPNLFRIFNATGWNTSFHYGGNLEFANVRTLMTTADQIIEAKDLKGVKGPWGVHDEVVFHEFVEAVNKTEGAGFHVVFSSSSHEPFKVPNYTKYHNPYANSVAYADSCLGVLVHQLKRTSLWENSLVIITADHGSILPDRELGYRAANYHVPLVVTGGLVDTSLIVKEVVSHFDVPLTILDACGLQADLPFSQSLLAPRGIAFYNYYNGVVTVTDTCIQYYDIPLSKYMEGKCGPPYEKAFYQLAEHWFFRP